MFHLVRGALGIIVTGMAPDGCDHAKQGTKANCLPRPLVPRSRFWRRLKRNPLEVNDATANTVVAEYHNPITWRAWRDLGGSKSIPKLVTA